MGPKFDIETAMHRLWGLFTYSLTAWNIRDPESVFSQHDMFWCFDVFDVFDVFMFLMFSCFDVFDVFMFWCLYIPQGVGALTRGASNLCISREIDSNMDIASCLNAAVHLWGLNLRSSPRTYHCETQNVSQIKIWEASFLVWDCPYLSLTVEYVEYCSSKALEKLNTGFCQILLFKSSPPNEIMFSQINSWFNIFQWNIWFIHQLH